MTLCSLSPARAWTDPAAPRKYILGAVSIPARVGRRYDGRQWAVPRNGDERMRYLILIGHDERGGKNLSEEEHRALFVAYQKYEKDLKQAGVLLGGEPLEPTAKASRISSEAGKRKVVDGPFSESKEIIGGYVVIDAKTREEAMEWAARCPAAQLGSFSYVELRQIQEIPR